MNKEIKNAIYITSLLFDEMKKSLIYLIMIMYEFNEQNSLNNEKLNVESLLKFLTETSRKNEV